jgi:hypothetical protein
MTSEKQLLANRLNAQKSTGPRSLPGKTVSARNAVKHGLLSRDIVLQNEDPEEFDALLSRLRHDMQPKGIIECELVENLAVDLWRLRRVRQVETSIFNRHFFIEMEARAKDRTNRLESLSDTPVSNTMVGTNEVLENFTTEPDDDKKAVTELQEGGASSKSELTLMGEVFLRDVRHYDSLAKLSRYQFPIQRNFFRTLRELERLQHARRRKSRDENLDEDLI